MKKVVCFGLCFLIVLCSFVCSFADTIYSDSPEPAVLPEGDSSSTTGLHVKSNNIDYYFVSSGYPVYLIYFKDPNNNYSSRMFFSDSPDSVVFTYNATSGTRSTVSLNRYYNGYYFSSDGSLPSDYPIYLKSGATAQNVIDDINNTVFKTTFDLSALVDGSVSWLSTMAQAVKSSGLLLFMVLIGFVGICIGLFRRFTNG